MKKQSSSFRERLHGVESDRLFTPMIPTITQMADLVVDEIKNKFSTPKYSGGRSLNINWVPSNSMQASASLKDGNYDDHVISIHYGMPIAIYKDAILFPQMCTRHFIEKKYDELFVHLDYGCGRNNVLPVGSTHESIKIDFFTLSMAWIYLHEQAHLFQGHWNATGDSVTLASNYYTFHDKEFCASDVEITPTSESWVSHSLELSADFEATNLIFQYLLFKDGGCLTIKSLWAFICGVTCLFHKFYGDKREYHNGNAIGSHPDPSFRMRCLFSEVMSLLENYFVSKFLDENVPIETYKDAMIHAFNVANMYMKIAHFEDDTFPEFMTRFSERNEDFSHYVSGINSRWKIIRANIVKNHFGWGDVSIMPELHLF